MEGALAAAAAITDQRQKIEHYRLILASVLSSSPVDTSLAKRFIDHSARSRPLILRRLGLLLSSLVCSFLRAGSGKAGGGRPEGDRSLRFSSDPTQSRVLIIREKLAELYESEQQWSKAAQMLSGIDLDSGVR
ncbi:hypothetical protein BHM03_00060944 [Ensete ventricosum]|uniref:Uncharacterized protein n=1 Tax=Ensete ventricosum TaxID=4639 RepID=A0A426X430_ENSVE|nr:hypothetical protein B296_00055683 [Ensete ventricosum]RZS27464.1 hypothetical protein BHM03_00060944 [Ensete ventricosum]